LNSEIQNIKPRRKKQTKNKKPRRNKQKTYNRDEINKQKTYNHLHFRIWAMLRIAQIRKWRLLQKYKEK